MDYFTELIRASTRPVVTVMMAFTFMWMVFERMIDAREALTIVVMVLAYWFGERKAGK